MKIVKRLFIILIIILLLLGGALWWLLSYIAPDEQLGMSYSPIDVKDKAMDMVKKLKPELVLTESDINDLIKMNLKAKYASSSSDHPNIEIAKDVSLDGAAFELEENMLIAHLNVTYKERIPAALDAVYSLQWQSPNLVLRPESLSIKGTQLPLSNLETIVVPLDLPAQDVVSVKDVQFEKGQIKILFKLQFQIRL